MKRYFQNYFVPRVLKLSWRHNFASWWKILKYKKLEISRTWVFYEIKSYEIVPHRMKFQMSSFYADVTYVIYFMSIKYISSTKPTKFETYFEVGVHWYISCYWSLSIPPENIRKPEVFWCSQRVLKDTSGMKWVNKVLLKVPKTKARQDQFPPF